MAEIVRVSAEESGERLDKFVVTKLPTLSRSFAQHLIEAGHVRVSGQPRKSHYRLNEGEAVEVSVPPPQPPRARAEEIPLKIVHEDEALLVIDKAAGIVVHPAAGHTSGTLVNAVLAHAPGLLVGNVERPGIVHRLDRDTSGLIVIAKNDAALKNLQRQFASRSVHKIYLALVRGNVEVSRGKIDAPLARDPHDRKRFAVVNLPEARQAVTIFYVEQRLSELTLLRVEPQTGRTHQIRVHLAFIHHPVVGDGVYGRGTNSLGLRRQFLHAWRITFAHPDTGAQVQFTAPLPFDLTEALARAGGDLGAIEV